MQVDVRTSSEYDFCLKYLRIWAGVFSGGWPVTEVELRVLAGLMVKRRELERQGLKGSKLLVVLWSPEERDDILERCGVSKANFYNKVSHLKKKGLITEKRDFVPQIIPQQQITFNFDVPSEA